MDRVYWNILLCLENIYCTCFILIESIENSATTMAAIHNINNSIIVTEITAAATATAMCVRIAVCTI